MAEAAGVFAAEVVEVGVEVRCVDCEGVLLAVGEGEALADIDCDFVGVTVGEVLGMGITSSVTVASLDSIPSVSTRTYVKLVENGLGDVDGS